MPKHKLNKTIAGYHILMILSAVDFRFNIHEDLVIKEWLTNEFPFHVNLDNEMEIISALSPKDWEKHFFMCIDDYYDDATDKERLDLIEFSKKLILADDVLHESENIYYKLLINTWKEKRKNTK